MADNLDLEALRAKLVPTVKVQMGELEVPVTGLPLDSLVDICRRHWGDVNGLFDTLIAQVQAGDVDVNVGTLNWLGGTLLSAVPQVAAEIIAVCAGWSIEAASVIRQASFAVQLEALDAIGALTFTSEMPPKKVLETVIKMLVGATKPLLGSPS